MSAPRQAARACIVENNQLLTFERWRVDKETGKELHYLSIPGGGMEADETPEQGVVRELEEEMGIMIEPQCLLAIARMPRTYRDHVHYFFLARRTSGEPIFNVESEEAQQGKDNRYAIRWVPLDVATDPPFYFAYEPIFTAVLPYLQSGECPKEPLDIDIADLVQ